MAQAGSNDDKTGGRKSRWTFPLSDVEAQGKINNQIFLMTWITLQYFYVPSLGFNIITPNYMKKL